jgi:signal transduction histidine kinase
VAAAPVTPYTEPFTRAARQGTLALLAVAFLAFVVSSLLARQSTRSLERLAEATEAVSRGNFDQQVQTTGADDVGRVGRAFNTMTESLRRTLDELARRESLAKVGEFAAILAHEVRNPLTSIRINLQRMEEQVADEAELREPLSRVLGQIERLNATVTGALRVARSGTIRRAPIDLRTPLAAAIQAATPQFNTRETRLNSPALDGDPVYVDADPDALEQLFVNLLFNAAEALDHGGEAEVRLDASSHEVIVSVSDSGRGIPPSDRARVLELFYSTKPEGTGLGLAIAQRIALAHGGDLEIDDDPGPGTTVRVRLPIRGAGA